MWNSLFFQHVFFLSSAVYPDFIKVSVCQTCVFINISANYSCKIKIESTKSCQLVKLTAFIKFDIIK